MSPKGKAENHQKKQFSLCKNRKLSSLAFLVIKFLCLPARSFFCFLRCNPNRDINNAIKSAYKSLAKRHKAEKRVWVLLYFRYRQEAFFSRGSPLREEALESLGCKFLILFMRHILLLLKNLYRILLYERSFLAFVVNWNWFSKAAICEL